MVVRGSYCLCIRVASSKRIKVGALGFIAFPAGLYIYVGSALSSLAPRLSRHLRTSRGQGRVAQWHVDYLLRSPGVDIEEIWATDWAVRMECELSSEVAAKGTPIPHFGSGDCDCPSHLYRVEGCGFLKKLGLKKVDLRKLVTSS